MPLISVVMTSYNHEEFIDECIESVLGQDFDDFELIIVDDASSDLSRQIIDKYTAKDHRIRAILHEYNKGIPKTVNDGIEKAKGRFIAHIDSDDIWVPDKLTKQLAVLERNEDLIVWSEGEVIDRKGQTIGKTFSELEYDPSVSIKKSGGIFQELAKGNYILWSSLVYKRTNLGDVRRDESLNYLDDYKFVLDLARKYEFYYIAEPLTKYRVHGRNVLRGSSSETMKRRQIATRERVSIFEEVLRQYDPELVPDTKAYIYHSIAAYYYNRGEKKKGLRFYLRAVRYDPSRLKLLVKRRTSNLLSRVKSG